MGAGAIYPSPRAGQYSIGEMEIRAISPPHGLVHIQLGRWKHAPYPLPTGRLIYNWGDGNTRHIPSPRAGQYTIGEKGAGAISPPHGQVNIQLGRREQAPYPLPTGRSIYNYGDGSRRHISLPTSRSIFNWGDVNRGHISLPRAGQYSIGEMGAGAIYPSPRAGQYSIGEMGAGAIYPSHALVNKQLG